jgi:ABC-type dipeptide/oligopeptide/nickel transport system ATPase component
MTCRAIIGLLDRNKFHVSGSIAFEGTDLLAMKRQERRALYGKEIAMIPQNPMTAFDPSMRIGAQMQETLLIHGVVARNRAKQYIEEALRQAGLDDPRRVCHSYPYMMSGGMLQGY